MTNNNINNLDRFLNSLFTGKNKNKALPSVNFKKYLTNSLAFKFNQQYKQPNIRRILKYPRFFPRLVLIPLLGFLAALLLGVNFYKKQLTEQPITQIVSDAQFDLTQLEKDIAEVALLIEQDDFSQLENLEELD